MHTILTTVIFIAALTGALPVSAGCEIRIRVVNSTKSPVLMKWQNSEVKTPGTEWAIADLVATSDQIKIKPNAHSFSIYQAPFDCNHSRRFRFKIDSNTGASRFVYHPTSGSWDEGQNVTIRIFEQ